MPDRPIPPAQIAWLVEIAGENAALAVIEEFAGTRTYITESPEKGVSAVVAKFDQSAAAELSREYGGIYMRIPSCKPWRVQVLREQGLSHSKIARRLGIDVSSVERILQRAREDASRTRGDRAMALSIKQLSLKLD
ncbi:sigma factor-like helix-turn-helix DNA-binding protein [Acidisoma sp. 7E03]